MRARNRLLIILVTVAAALAVLRLALPAIAQSYVNSKLASMGDYSGRVTDVDIALLRGAYTLHELVVVKRGGDGETPFLDLETMDISLQWRALVHGELVGEIVARRPVLNLIQAETDQETQLGTGVNWPAEIRELFPFRFNQVEVAEGLIMFRAPGIESDESLTLTDARLALSDLTNVRDTEADAFSDLEFAGSFMGNAPLRITGRVEPNAEVPTFDLDISFEGARLVDVNPWLEEFLRVDAEQGVFSMYAELASAEGRFDGYVKPIMENPEIFELDEPGDGPLRKAWEALVGFATQLFENRQEDQVATQVPLSGEIENPDAGVIAAMVNLVRNAFVAALSRSLEGTVSLRDVDADANVDTKDDAEVPPPD